MKIIADENIIGAEYFFGKSHQLILKPGRAICRADLIDADILLVRSVTKVNEKLLKDTAVKFVGSPTIGFDHIDIKYLEKVKIAWSHAKGCNKQAVVEYVICVIAALQKLGFLQQNSPRIGIIGVGDIGSGVCSSLRELGFQVLVNDPIRAAIDKNFISQPLEDFHDLDFITLHTPLTFDGTHPTYHLIDKNFLKQLKPNAILLNTGRGSVINFSDLKKYGKHLNWCLDVWENEPDIDLDVLSNALIATPHIAGYSIQSKLRGISMIYQTAVSNKIIADENLAPIAYPTSNLLLGNKKCNWQDVVLKIYDPLNTTRQMKNNLLEQIATFDQLRKSFIDRYEFEFIHLEQSFLTLSCVWPDVLCRCNSFS